MSNFKISGALVLAQFFALSLPAKCADTISIGIMPFSNRVLPGALTRLEVLQEKKNHDYDYLENALVDIMLTELYEDRVYNLVERSRMEEFEKEIKFSESGAVDEATAPKAGKRLGAGYLFYGTIAKQNDVLILTPKLLDIGNRKEMPLGKVRTTEADIRSSIPMLRRLVYSRLPSPSPAGMNASIAPGTSVAFLPFNDNSRFKDNKGLRVRMPDKMLNEVIHIKNLKFVERMRIDLAFEELKLQHSGLIDEATALKIGKMVGAKTIVFGSFMAAGDILRIDARLCEVETGKMFAAVKAEGKASNDSEVIGAVGRRLKIEFERLLKK